MKDLRDLKERLTRAEQKLSSAEDDARVEGVLATMPIAARPAEDAAAIAAVQKGALFWQVWLRNRK